VSAKSEAKARRAERAAHYAEEHVRLLEIYARRGNLDAVEGLRRRIEGRRVAAVKREDFLRGRF
jgi:hypothetical protein